VETKTEDDTSWRKLSD